MIADESGLRAPFLATNESRSEDRLDFSLFRSRSRSRKPAAINLAGALCQSLVTAAQTRQRIPREIYQPR
jgi:hypothetical protein